MSPEPETDCGPDDPVERLIESVSRSREWAEQRSLALGGGCPTLEELADHAAGRLPAGRHRRLLAQHIVACPHCFERNLAQLARLGAEEPNVAAAPPRSSSPNVIPLQRGAFRLAPAIAAAAVLLLGCALLLGRIGGDVSSFVSGAALGGLHPADENGFETRNGGGAVRPDVLPRRVVAEIERDGFVALGRFAGAEIRVERVSGAATMAAVVAGEEVLLPLDRALECAIGETWLVIHGDRELSPSDVSGVMTRLAKGYQVDGFSAERITLRPR
jgi:hypothetical protein